jgi:predicted GNAT family acetyltransferase
LTRLDRTAKLAVMEVRVVHEPGRFVARVEGVEAEIVYQRRGDVLDLQYTWTPPALRGRDIAARLTDAAFAYAREHGLQIMPTCSYTRAYLARHPELQALTVGG